MGERLVLAAAGPGENNGIGDYAWRLTQAFGSDGPATLIVRRRASALETSGDAAIEHVASWRDLTTPQWMARGRRAQGVFVQYFPQAFVGRDFRALMMWLEARRQARGPVVATLHEY